MTIWTCPACRCTITDCEGKIELFLCSCQGSTPMIPSHRMADYGDYHLRIVEQLS